eukprot:gene30324-40297_t
MSGEELFIRGLYELVTGEMKSSIAEKFGRHCSDQSRAFKFFINHLYDNFHHLVDDNLPWWFNNGYIKRSAELILSIENSITSKPLKEPYNKFKKEVKRLDGDLSGLSGDSTESLGIIRGAIIDHLEDKSDSHVDNIVNQIRYTIDEMNRQESFQSKYPSLEFKSSEDFNSIVVNIEGFWYPVYSSTSGFSYNENLIKNVNNFLQRENDLIVKGYRYWYATVNSDGSIAVSETEAAALESRKDLNSY